jgi:hypothetical protein
MFKPPVQLRSLWSTNENKAPPLSAVKPTEEAGFKFNPQLKPYLRGEQVKLKPPFSFSHYGLLMRHASLSAKSDGHSRDP